MSRTARLAAASLFLVAVSGCLPGGSGCDDLADRVEITVTADGIDSLATGRLPRS